MPELDHDHVEASDTAVPEGEGDLIVPEGDDKSFFDRFPWMTAAALLLTAIGGLDLLIDGNLSDDFHEFLEAVAPLIGLTAIGRGIKKGLDR